MERVLVIGQAKGQRIAELQMLRASLDPFASVTRKLART